MDKVDGRIGLLQEVHRQRRWYVLLENHELENRLNALGGDRNEDDLDNSARAANTLRAWWPVVAEGDGAKPAATERLLRGAKRRKANDGLARRGVKKGCSRRRKLDSRARARRTASRSGRPPLTWRTWLRLSAECLLAWPQSPLGCSSSSTRWRPR